nr:immunoglobulin heavy chain junction region [Macaca mulatta]MOW19554.1 immunoglobulin heavy chain junction region [Macaca mulatta]MOW19689.1 immunoglobulin heavy chain junction region [Macaca mulatta]MOW19741.1 immunoglobulin heavy chain junction region [Macaca mulatta]MOW20011.1 immunoglobulin heavy chain junction region [Macaca mulatta]
CARHGYGLFDYW